MLQTKKIFLGLCLLGLILMMNLSSGLADEGLFPFQKTISGVKLSYQAYFPGTDPYSLSLLKLRPLSHQGLV